jgi:hypothetical protein
MSGFALRVHSVDTCTVPLDEITAFAVPNANCFSQKQTYTGILSELASTSADACRPDWVTGTEARP